MCEESGSGDAANTSGVAYAVERLSVSYPHPKQPNTHTSSFWFQLVERKPDKVAAEAESDVSVVCSGSSRSS